MNEQRFERKMAGRERPWERYQHRRKHGGRGIGLFLVIIGGLLLMRAGGIFFPVWFFSWPMLLIAVGLISGINHNFRGFGWLIPVFVGAFFLFDDVLPDLRLRPFVWPLALVMIGIFFLLRPRRRYDWHDENSNGLTQPVREDEPYTKTEWQAPANDNSDVIDATAVFGGVKKFIVSKNFKGGDLTTFMGGAEINLLQADFTGTVMIDCFNMFGGTKLIVPADWQVKSELTTIFGGIEDKRQPSQGNPAKVLYLDGTCIFGGVEIKSF